MRVDHVGSVAPNHPTHGEVLGDEEEGDLEQARAPGAHVLEDRAVREVLPAPPEVAEPRHGQLAVALARRSTRNRGHQHLDVERLRHPEREVPHEGGDPVSGPRRVR